MFLFSIRKTVFTESVNLRYLFLSLFSGVHRCPTLHMRWADMITHIHDNDKYVIIGATGSLSLSLQKQLKVVSARKILTQHFINLHRFFPEVTM